MKIEKPRKGVPMNKLPLEPLGLSPTGRDCKRLCVSLVLQEANPMIELDVQEI